MLRRVREYMHSSGVNGDYQPLDRQEDPEDPPVGDRQQVEAAQAPPAERINEDFRLEVHEAEEAAEERLERQRIRTTHRAGVRVDVCRDELGEYTVIYIHANPDYPTYLVTSFRIHRTTLQDVEPPPRENEERHHYGNRTAAREQR